MQNKVFITIFPFLTFTFAHSCLPHFSESVCRIVQLRKSSPLSCHKGPLRCGYLFFHNSSYKVAPLEYRIKKEYLQIHFTPHCFATPETMWPPLLFFPLETSFLHPWFTYRTFALVARFWFVKIKLLSAYNMLFLFSERGRGFRVPACGDQWHERQASAAHQGSPGHQSHGGGDVLEELQQGRLLHRGSGQGALGSRQLPTLLMFNSSVPL